MEKEYLEKIENIINEELIRRLKGIAEELADAITLKQEVINDAIAEGLNPDEDEEVQGYDYEEGTHYVIDLVLEELADLGMEDENAEYRRKLHYWGRDKDE